MKKLIAITLFSLGMLQTASAAVILDGYKLDGNAIVTYNELNGATVANTNTNELLATYDAGTVPAPGVSGVLFGAALDPDVSTNSFFAKSNVGSLFPGLPPLFADNIIFEGTIDSFTAVGNEIFALLNITRNGYEGSVGGPRLSGSKAILQLSGLSEVGSGVFMNTANLLPGFPVTGPLASAKIFNATQVSAPSVVALFLLAGGFVFLGRKQPK